MEESLRGLILREFPHEEILEDTREGVKWKKA